MKSRVLLLALAFAGAFALLFGRVAYLKVALGDELRRRGAETRRRVEAVGATRGRILDRRGRALAHDVPAFRLAAVLADLEPGSVIPSRVARIIRRKRADMEARWRAAAGIAATGPDGPPLAIAEAPSEASAKAFRSLAAQLEGLSVEGASLLAAPRLLLQRAAVLARLARLTGQDEAALAARVEKAIARAAAEENPVERMDRLHDPLPLTGTAPFEVVAEVEEDARLFPGIVVEAVCERRYPAGDAAAHIVGYVGAPEGRAVEAFGARARVADRAGVTGIEAARNLALAGTPGARLVEWNRRTRSFEVLAEEPSVPGADVRLALDLDLQRDVEAALDRAVAEHGGRREGHEGGGSAILLDARTGEVLALASAPRFDPGRVRLDIAELNARRPSPFLHRAIASRLPPGSIVKTLTAAAGLEAGAIAPGRPIRCEGGLGRGNRFRCNAAGGHGDIVLEDALARSCNVFFYRTGEALGEAPLTAWFRAFGLGARTGIELSGEAEGLVPSAAWMRARFGGGWSTPDDWNTAIGQGNVLVTPLQAARLAAAIASGGTLFRPRLVLGAGRELDEIPDETHMQVAPATWAAVRAGMVACVESDHGSARKSDLARFRAAAKTGTAQAGPAALNLAHAWVIGFAPHERPEVAFAVCVELVEHGRHGGDVAGPVAARMLEAYFGRSRD